jgi:hypothetical protein
LIDPTFAELFWLTLFVLPEVAGWIDRRIGRPATP